MSWTAASDSFDADSLCMGCQRFQIVWIGGEYRSARLCERDDDGVDRGSAARPSTQEGGASRHGLRHAIDHVACLQKLVFIGVASRVPLQALNENYRGNGSRPEVFLPTPKGPSRSSRSRRRSSSAVCSGVNASSSSRRLLQRSSIRSTFSSAVNVERSSAGFAMPLSLARHPTFAKGRADRKRHGGQSSADENAPRLAPANEPNANSGSPATWRTGALKAAAVAHSARSFSSRPHRARPW
jgi:hypothetical protein